MPGVGSPRNGQCCCSCRRCHLPCCLGDGGAVREEGRCSGLVWTGSGELGRAARGDGLRAPPALGSSMSKKNAGTSSVTMLVCGLLWVGAVMSPTGRESFRNSKNKAQVCSVRGSCALGAQSLQGRKPGVAACRPFLDPQRPLVSGSQSVHSSFPLRGSVEYRGDLCPFGGLASFP